LIADQVMKIWVKNNMSQNLFAQESILGDWFIMTYTENRGMAFGTTFGDGVWAKLGLSIFRIIAIAGIAYYFVKQVKKGVRMELLLAIGLIFAGATGNLIDSMCYDYIFPLDKNLGFNYLDADMTKLRPTGFLLGNVVDMFQFTTKWPSWVPWYNEHPTHPSDNEIFPAIWNIADAAISIGVLMVIFRQRAYFPKEKKEQITPASEETTPSEPS
jgi:signal peptidase II